MTISRGLRNKVRVIKFSKSHMKSQYMCSSMGKVHQDKCINHLHTVQSEKKLFPWILQFHYKKVFKNSFS